MKKSSRSESKQSGPGRDKRSRRNVLVVAALLGALSLTSVVLLALAPAPLVPDGTRSLFATDDTLEMVFDTPVPVAAGQWNRIYVHQSKTRWGDAASIGKRTGGLGDHFLIGNGDGCADGAIQVGDRWARQQPAKPAGATVGGSVISICLVGDFDHAAPTPQQMRGLQQLVSTLRKRLGMGNDAVVIYDRSDSAGVGRRFPRGSFLKAVEK